MKLPSLPKSPPSQEVLRIIPRDICERLCLVPIRVEGPNLTLAMSEFDVRAIDEVKFFTGYNLDPNHFAFVDKKEINEAIELWYPQDQVRDNETFLGIFGELLGKFSKRVEETTTATLNDFGEIRVLWKKREGLPNLFSGAIWLFNQERVAQYVPIQNPETKVFEWTLEGTEMHKELVERATKATMRIFSKGKEKEIHENVELN